MFKLLKNVTWGPRGTPHSRLRVKQTPLYLKCLQVFPSSGSNPNFCTRSSPAFHMYYLESLKKLCFQKPLQMNKSLFLEYNIFCETNLPLIVYVYSERVSPELRVEQAHVLISGATRGSLEVLIDKLPKQLVPLASLKLIFRVHLE
jgi:hypothetical protein